MRAANLSYSHAIFIVFVPIRPIILCVKQNVANNYKRGRKKDCDVLTSTQ
jgi:hypothetical protein